MKKIIEIKNYTLRKGQFELSDCSFDIYEGEILAIVGKTGSGKTLLMESIAGFYCGNEGCIFHKGIDIKTIPIEKRKIGFVYQEYMLFPHINVYENIAYGLKLRKFDKTQIESRVFELASLFSIKDRLSNYPGTLSGGEKQRVALARSLSLKPEVLLLDEPFSALDPSTKLRMYKELKNIHKALKFTMVFVTHDFSEAVNLANRVVVISDGKIKGVRDSRELFKYWDDENVNYFLGLEEEHGCKSVIQNT